jgi:leader peptidase (prepilin peptidase)/N-methyltransferase
MVTGISALLFGLAVGSFLNVCIDRLPRGQSILHPRSYCPACKTPLAARDLVPVLSYALLRGRCRYCSAPIPKRVVLVEAGTAMLFLVFWSMCGASVHFLLAVLAACVLLVVLIIGIEHRVGPGRRRGSPQAERKGVRDGVRR